MLCRPPWGPGQGHPGAGSPRAKAAPTLSFQRGDPSQVHKYHVPTRRPAHGQRGISGQCLMVTPKHLLLM